MKVSLKKTKEAYDLLEKYEGINPYIKTLKYHTFDKKDKILNDLELEYVLKNYNFNPERINKVVKITKWFGEKCKEKWQLEFVPEKLQIIDLLGETESTFHVYVKYRRSQDKPVTCFITKKDLLDDFRIPDYNDLDVDFTEYNEILSKYEKSLYEHQKSAVKFLLSRHKTIIGDDMGLGKMEFVDNKVFTPNGRKRIGDIKRGDKIIGSDGLGHNVIDVFPQGVRDLFKVTFNDGCSILVGGEHLWTVQSNNASKTDNRSIKADLDRKNKFIVLSTNQMLDKNLKLKHKGIDCNKNKEYEFSTYYKNNSNELKWQIPIVKPIQFKNNPILPLSPYLLGLSLGDGHFTKNQIKFDVHKNDYSELFENLPIREIGLGSVKKGNKRMGVVDNVKDILIELGLDNKKSFNKFIPDNYKYSSIEERLSVLRGLMDTDGYCMIGKKNGTFSATEYCTVSEQLANDVAEIVHSLGGIVRKHSKIGSYTKYGVKHECRRAYRLNIKMPDNINPFKLKRKVDLYNTPKKYKVNRYIKNIEPCGNGESVCISVDSPDNLYVTEHGIVTHNTTSVVVSSLVGNFKKILIICPASLKSNWKRELKTFVSEDDIGIVNGNDWVCGKKYTIINYDIVNRFYEIPTETVKLDGVSKNVKSRKKDVIEKAKLNSTLLTENFDLIIIDEAHKLSNNTSNRYKVIEDFIDRSNIRDIYLMTGTPITNRPLNFLNVLSLIGHELSKNWEYYVRTYCDGKQITPQKTGKPIWITSGASNLDELREKVKNCYIRRVKGDIPDMVSRNVVERYYDLTNEERNEYNIVWDEYEKSQVNIGKTNLNRDLIEGILLRIKISEFMISRTIELANEILEDGEKVFIGCVFNNEIDSFKEYYGDKCVIYNGSMSSKQKDAAEKKFMTDAKTTVFIGNIIASGVGLNLTAASKMIINSMSFVPSDYQQLIDRLHRLTQTKDVYAYIQLFNDTISERVWGTIIKKQLIIDKVIKKEDDK